MCGTCGCSENNLVHIYPNAVVHSEHEHEHHHSGDNHSHEHYHHPENSTRTLEIKQSILQKNDRLAERNRGYFLAKDVFVLNLVSSPGSGKTSLLERTTTDLQNQFKSGIVVGDLETDNDAQRLREKGISTVQITTGTLCHLEADMVLQAAKHLDLDHLDLLIIENVGNLVCPASYDLGEDVRVVMLSTTEGEDKPLKYPTMFKSADVVIINKIDIAEVVGFDRDKALNSIQKMNPHATIFEVSARTGQGMQDWYDYLIRECRNSGKVGTGLQMVESGNVRSHII